MEIKQSEIYNNSTTIRNQLWLSKIPVKIELC